MAILTVKEIHTGRGGDHSGKLGRSIRKHTRAYRVTTSDVYDSDYDVLLYCPALGSVHPDDAGAWCVSKRASQDKGKKVWNCQVEYSSERALNENPLSDPTRYKWSTEGKTQTFAYDKDNEAILNAAGEPFITGITDEISSWTITARKNLAAVPAAILTYADAVNSDNVVVDGVPFTPDKLKITKIEISELQNRNETYFRELSMVFKVQDTWKRKIIEQGLNQKVSGAVYPCFETKVGIDEFAADHSTSARLAYLDKFKARKPMPLNADGTQMTVPVTDPANIIWKTVDLRKTLAFSSLPLDLSMFLGS